MKKQENRLVQFLKGIAAVLVALVFIGFGIGTSRSMPDSAVLYVNEETKTYLSPPCFDAVKQEAEAITEKMAGASIEEHKNNPKQLVDMFNFLGSSRLTTKAEIRRMPYKPDTECRDAGGFMQDGRSLSGLLLEYVGLLPPLPSRWNPDGTWNW